MEVRRCCLKGRIQLQEIVVVAWAARSRGSRSRSHLKDVMSASSCPSSLRLVDDAPAGCPSNPQKGLTISFVSLYLRSNLGSVRQHTYYLIPYIESNPSTLSDHLVIPDYLPIITTMRYVLYGSQGRLI